MRSANASFTLAVLRLSAAEQRSSAAAAARRRSARSHTSATMSNEDPLELEHMIGYTGQHAASVQFHPTEPETVVCFIGRLVVISNVLDPHQQEFLRGHEEEITALTISPSGNYLASGQVSSVRVPNSEAKVIVWDFKTRQPVYSLIDLNDGNAFSQNRVVQLAFSSDEAFLAGCDDQRGCKLCVWKTQTGELEVLAGKQPQLAFLQWGRKLQGAKKHASYELYTGSNSKVVQQLLEHDPRTMQYKLSGSAMQMPSSGLSRDYYCAQMHGGYDYIVTGSSSGEMCVFNTNTLVFRACVPVSCGGVHALVTCVIGSPDGGARAIAYCGCGDGHLKMLAGQDLSWEMLGETALSGKIVALSISADGAAARNSGAQFWAQGCNPLHPRSPTRRLPPRRHLRWQHLPAGRGDARDPRAHRLRRRRRGGAPRRRRCGGAVDGLTHQLDPLPRLRRRQRALHHRRDERRAADVGALVLQVRLRGGAARREGRARPRPRRRPGRPRRRRRPRPAAARLRVDEWAGDGPRPAGARALADGRGAPRRRHRARRLRPVHPVGRRRRHAARVEPGDARGGDAVRRAQGRGERRRRRRRAQAPRPLVRRRQVGGDGRPQAEPASTLPLGAPRRGEAHAHGAVRARRAGASRDSNTGRRLGPRPTHTSPRSALTPLPSPPTRRSCSPPTIRARSSGGTTARPSPSR